MAPWSDASAWISYLGSPHEDPSGHSKGVSHLHPFQAAIDFFFFKVIVFSFKLYCVFNSYFYKTICFSLAYLHEAIEPKVVHRDIKSSNILIDYDFNAKVSDFGLAKLLGAGKSHVTTRVMGTFGLVFFFLL